MVFANPGGGPPPPIQAWWPPKPFLVAPQAVLSVPDAPTMNEPTPLVTINFRKLGEVQRIIDEAIAAVTNKIDVVSAGTRTLGQNSTRILFANTLAMHAVYNLTDPVLMRLLEKVLADVKSIKGDSAGFVSSSSILMLANYLAARGVKIELKTLKNAIEAGVGSIGQRDLRGITQYKSVGKILESCGRATGVKLPEGVPLAKHAEILVAISEGQGMVLIELVRDPPPPTLTPSDSPTLPAAPSPLPCDYR